MVSAMSAPPTGTVTLLFTDIEGSTRLWDRQPDAMTSALGRHDELLRSTIEAAGGYVFKTVGDAFCAAFATAREAVAAAAAAQSALHQENWPDPVSVRVRMALHTGECEERDGDYFGPAVNRTARLESLGHGGQVLLSRATADLIRDWLPTGTQLVNLGSHDLRDLDRPEEVFQLVIEGVPAAFPPLRSTSDVATPLDQPNPTNLSRPASSFVGRDGEMSQVVNLLTDCRLVTLTGSGGVGKTRLATEVGRHLLEDIPDGVWLVELASVTNPDLVADEVLRDLGIAEQVGKGAAETLIDVVRSQRRLVILDNCEHVLDGCAAIADSLVRKCSEIRVLSTSREPLRIDGEVIYRVPSLSLPPERVDEVDDLADSGAVALFVERATAQRPGFQLTDEDAALVGSICRRLDGMPLALELATARLRSMSLAQLHQRLEHRFGLLTGGNRIAPARQQTLEALVDWSYGLLNESEQALFRRISVFVDGFDLESAEIVCALDDVPRPEIADLLASLVDKSLVVAEPQGEAVRYRVQETLHEYGSERLTAESGREGSTSEAERVAAGHADYYLTLAEEAEPHLLGPSSRSWLARLDTEERNLRAAIEFALDTPEGARRVLHQFWWLQRHWSLARRPAEALQLLDRALERVGADIADREMAKALYCKALILRQVNVRQELSTIAEALALARRASDTMLEADILAVYCQSLAFNGRSDEAIEAGTAAVSLARRLGDPVLLGAVLLQFAITLYQVDDSRAEGIFHEVLGLVEQTGDSITAMRVHNVYALLLLRQDELAEARHHLEVALELSGSEIGARSIPQHLNLGWVLLSEGDAERARSSFATVLRARSLNGALVDTAYAVLGTACCQASLGNPELAATLHGGADALLAVASDQWEVLEERIRAQNVAELRDQLREEFERHYATGRSLAHDEIIKLALSRTRASSRYVA